MKIQDIEPILYKVATYFEYSPESICDGFGYGKDEVVDAMESMHCIVCKTIANRRNKAMKHDPLLENAGKRWSTEDDEYLEEMFIDTFKPSDPTKFYIAASEGFKRSAGAIRSRLGHWQFISNPYDQEYAELQLRKLRRQHKS